MFYTTIFVTISVLTLFSLGPKGKAHFASFTAVLAVFLIITIAFRFESVDYEGYRRIFSDSSLEHIGFPFFSRTSDTTGNEFVFAFVAAIFRWLSVPFHGFLLLIAVASVTIRFAVFRKISPHFFLSVLLYMSAAYFKDLGQIRNALASAITLLALRPMHERKPFQFMAIIMLSFGIQAFSLVMLPTYWVYPVVRTHKHLTYIALMVCVGVALAGGAMSLLIPFFESQSSKFFRAVTNYYYGSRNIELYFHPFNISNLVFAFLFLHYYYKQTFTNAHSLIPAVITFHFYGTVFYFFAIDFTPLAGRMSELVWYNTLPILLPTAYQMLSVRIQPVVLMLLLLYSIGLFYSISQGAAPYQLVFFS